MRQGIHISERGTRLLYNLSLGDLADYSLEGIEQEDVFNTGYSTIILVNNRDEHMRVGEMSYGYIRQEDLDYPLVGIIDAALERLPPPQRVFTEEQLEAMREDAWI